MLKGIQMGLLAMALAGVGGVAADEKRHSDKVGLEDQVERLNSLTPNTAGIMFQVGHRYQDLYWAARLGKWEFAEYQLEELEALLETLQVAVPRRAPSTQVFLDQGLEGFEAAFKARDWNAFQQAFRNMHEHCMVCHAANDHAFIKVPAEPATAHSVILNLPRQ